MEIKYRLANNNDIPFMTSILLEAAKASGHIIKAEELKNFPETEIYVKNWPNENECGVIAETSEEIPVGAAWIRNIQELGHNIKEPLPELTIGVIDNFQRKGIAGELMNKLYLVCQENGIHKISLGVHKDNIPAIKLYEKHGWEIDGYFENYQMMSRKTSSL